MPVVGFSLQLEESKYSVDFPLNILEEVGAVQASFSNILVPKGKPGQMVEHLIRNERATSSILVASL